MFFKTKRRIKNNSNIEAFLRPFGFSQKYYDKKNIIRDAYIPDWDYKISKNNYISHSQVKFLPATKKDNRKCDE